MSTADEKTCFVILPPKDLYESRFEKIYKPALVSAGLTVERAGGPGVDVLIDDVKDKIKRSVVCFADVTEDNANVWYEKGYVNARNKKIIMVCNEDKRELSKLPFDVGHRQCLGYKEMVDGNENASNELKEKIAEDAKAKMRLVERDNPPQRDDSLDGIFILAVVVGLAILFSPDKPPHS